MPQLREMMELDRCPVCEVGLLAERPEVKNMSFDGRKISYLSLSSVCSHCGSVLANPEQSEKNKRAVTAAKRSARESSIAMGLFSEIQPRPNTQRPTLISVVEANNCFWATAASTARSVAEDVVSKVVVVMSRGRTDHAPATPGLAGDFRCSAIGEAFSVQTYPSGCRAEDSNPAIEVAYLGERRKRDRLSVSYVNP